jgi:hypothetical protein
LPSPLPPPVLAPVPVSPPVAAGLGVLNGGEVRPVPMDEAALRALVAAIADAAGTATATVVNIPVAMILRMRLMVCSLRDGRRSVRCSEKSVRLARGASVCRPRDSSVTMKSDAGTTRDFPGVQPIAVR